MFFKRDAFVPRSKTCFDCGRVKESSNLKDRVFQCEPCRAGLDRNVNAIIST
ncbi:zinc ribbon domain-containing protein [Helicobacter felistomachi]|uniref:zinc ribbon domain-containing protein n=1 Tax=Helicobacter felistomachi TaxID=3040201 RepID=UPI00336A9067